MIKLENIYKKYNKNSLHHALNNVSLHVEKGDIFGIIGFSGAGKSTLLRTINLLERPNKGKVIVNKVDLNKLDNNSLAKERKNIGMIFQHFNLLRSKTIYKNVALPLELSKTNKTVIKQRVNEVVKLVGLEKQIYKYPNNISGGQKQRVGIARALTNNPDILLCDEATSALDPATTLSILELLKNINKTMGLTIVLITHEIHVVKAICNKMAVIDKGKIIETGETSSIFSHPKQDITKILLNHDDTTTSNTKEYDYIISVSLTQDSNNLDFITALGEYASINIVKSNLTNNQGNLCGELTFKIKLHKSNLDIVKNMLIQFQLTINSIT